MAAPPDDKRPPMAVAMEWVSQITTVVLEMVLPGLGGQWLDVKLGTGFIGLVGFAVGVTVGIWHLVLMTRPRGGSGSSSGAAGRSRDDSGSQDGR